MQVLNIAPAVQNARPAFNSAKRAEFGSRFLNSSDTVAFTSRRDRDEGEEAGAPRRRHRGGKVVKGALGVLAALGLASGGVQCYNAGSAILAQRALADSFKDNPKNVAMLFVNSFSNGGFGADTMHFEQSGDALENPFEIKNWESFPGPQSTIAYDFTDGVFSSASLDIDGDRHPEITVTTDEDGKLVISYDYDSDGKVDTVETLDAGEE